MSCKTMISLAGESIDIPMKSQKIKGIDYPSSWLTINNHRTVTIYNHQQ